MQAQPFPFWEEGAVCSCLLCGLSTPSECKYSNPRLVASCSETASLQEPIHMWITYPRHSYPSVSSLRAPRQFFPALSLLSDESEQSSQPWLCVWKHRCLLRGAGVRSRCSKSSAWRGCLSNTAQENFLQGLASQPGQSQRWHVARKLLNYGKHE